MHVNTLGIFTFIATFWAVGCSQEFASGGTVGDASVGGSSAVSNIPREGLQLWLRADLGVTATSGSVSTWADQSGHNFDATQSERESQPTQVLGGIGTRAAIRFDGSDDFLSLPAGMSDFSQGLTVFSVLNQQASSWYNCIVEFSNGSEVNDISFAEYQDKFQYEVIEDVLTGPDINYNVAQLLTLVHRADTTMITRSNGELSNAAQFPLPESITREQNFVGKSLYGGGSGVTYSGLMGEILVYARGLSDNEVQTVEAELKQRWSL